jgi:hypothetical protein
MIDEDKSGQVDAIELKKAFMDESRKHYDKEEFERMMNSMDQDHNGQVTKSEFIYWYLNKLEVLYNKKITLEDDLDFI